MSKKITGIFLAILLAFTTLPATAEHGKDSEKTCAMSGEKCDKDSKCAKCCESDDATMCPIVGKILKKAHFLLDNADAIGLSEDQVTQIKTIKMETKKSSVRMAADYEIFTMDLMSKMGEDTIDVDGINAMLDQAGAGMTASGKASVQSYAKLKSILTDEQKVKAKEIWKKK